MTDTPETISRKPSSEKKIGANLPILSSKAALELERLRLLGPQEGESRQAVQVLAARLSEALSSPSESKDMPADFGAYSVVSRALSRTQSGKSVQQGRSMSEYLDKMREVVGDLTEIARGEVPDRTRLAMLRDFCNELSEASSKSYAAEYPQRVHPNIKLWAL